MSVQIVTHNRPEELFEAIDAVLAQSYPKIELLVVENGSAPDVVERNRQRMRAYPTVQYFVLEKNLGVSGGRNFALERAGGDLVVEIDDDVVFLGRGMIAKLVEFMEGHPRVGVVAFKIVGGDGGEVRRWEYPFLDKSRDTDLPGACGWFIGAGHAFSRAMLDRVGRYRDFAPWGEEEQDMALRVLDAGFEIQYLPGIRVLHKQSPKGRIQQNWRKGAIHLANKLKVPLLNLPWLSVVTYSLVRATHTMFIYRDVRVPVLAGFYLAKRWRYLRSERRRLKPETLKKLSALRGHRYY